MSPTYTVEVRYRGRHIGWMDRDEPEVIDATSWTTKDELPAWKLAAGVRDYIFHDEPVQMAVKAMKWERLEKR